MHVHVSLALLVLVLSAGVLDLALLGVRGVSAETETCQHNLQHTTANCSGRGLDRVPWGLHHNIDTLELSNNRSVLAGFPQIFHTQI